ncbi:MAG: transposase [Verrucomicrobiae bacterium]|nr:transposase [Verrucomicrobiae bacterium]
MNWHRIRPPFLPPYSPDLNPIERPWQYLKSHYLGGFITKDSEALADNLEESIRDLLNRPDQLQFVCPHP